MLRIFAIAVMCLGLGLETAGPSNQAQAQVDNSPRVVTPPAKGARKPYSANLTFPDGLSIGAVGPGEVRTVTVKVRNQEKEPVHVRRIRGSCPCITVDVKPFEIPAGEVRTFDLTVDAPMQVGHFSKRLFIDCVGYGSPVNETIGGEITYPIRVRSNGRPDVRERESILSITSVDERPFTILSIDGVPVESKTDKAHGKQYTVSGVTADEIPRWVLIETDHPDARLVPLRVNLPQLWKRWRGSGSWRWTENMVNLGAVDPTEPVRFSATIASLPLNPDRQIDLTTTTPGVGARVVAMRKPAKGNGSELEVELLFEEPPIGVISTVVYAKVGNKSSGLDVFGYTELETP